MDREILFRGKRTDNGEWVFGFVTMMWGQIHIVDIDNENTAYLVIPETVGQYTGLTDKNGKKIFEGDILEFTNGDGEKTLYKVYWDSVEAAYMIAVIEWDAVSDMSYWEETQSLWEVIGNIYDHPDLLQ